MRLFIASHSKVAAERLREAIISRGHACTSRWIVEDSKFHLGVESYTDMERAKLARMDEEDVRTADALLLISEPHGRNVPGGKHVETGIALALGKPVFVLGRKENIFHWHPSVRVLSSQDALLDCLDRYSPVVG